jgi:septal ring factor EnvC (AmiA/AmiB activator)
MKARLTIVVALALAGVLAPRAPAAHGQLGTSAAVDPITRLSQIDGEIAAALSTVEQTEADGARVEAELAGVVAARASGNHRLAERTRALYRLTRAGVLPVAGGFEALLTHAARVARLTRMLERDVAEMRELRARAEALREETGEITGRLESARQQVASLESEKARLLETAGQLSAFDVALGGGEGGGGTISISGDGFGLRLSEPDPDAPGSAFEAQRGALALPIAAPTSTREARREEGVGLELAGTRGATVRAAAAGHVAYADRHPGYGSLVIVDHGGSYFTVYGGLGAIDAQVGDEIPRGGRVGSVGSGAVFFQVRRGTRPLDTRAWLGI